MKCRHCHTPLTLPLVDLATSPPSNAYLRTDQLDSPERWYPLRVLVCEHCWLVQTEDFTQADQLFDADYAYFSSFSDAWLKHAQSYVTTMIERFGLSAAHRVVEIASNDGYLLQYVQTAGIPCYGIEPTASTAAAARAKGVESIECFFGTALAEELVAQGRQADLIAANNVLAHVPDINDFVAGFAQLLTPAGVATFEFPHLLKLLEHCQFDTIYHEHFSYLSLTAVARIFEANGLQVFDVEEWPTHGGSLRVFAQRAGGPHDVSPAVAAMLTRETQTGLTQRDTYHSFQARAEAIKNAFVGFLLECKARGERVAAYGAAAKGNTLINFAGIRADLLAYVVDRNPAKQGKFLPGSRIPIVSPDHLIADQPAWIVILPWNLRDEVIGQMAEARQWGARFVTAIPDLAVHRMKHVLVTGANGFIGRAVLPLLAARGWQISAVSRQPHDAASASTSWHTANLFDTDATAELLGHLRPTHLLHLAWNTEHGRFWQAPDNLRWMSASLSLLQAFAQAGGKRAVVAGTCAEYDWNHGFCRENVTPCAPRSLYGEAKLATHRLARRLLADADTQLAWARVFFPYGPGEAAGRLIPSVMRAMDAGGPVRCSHGLQYRDFLHVDDVAAAFAHLLDVADDGVFNIASGTPVQLRQIVLTLARLMHWTGTPDFGAIAVPDDDPPLLVGDITRLRGTSWQPTIGLDDGLTHTLADWRQQRQQLRSS